MLNNKLSYKLLNCALIMVIIFLIYKTGSLWLGIIAKIGELAFPFILAFAIAYFLYPILKYLEKKKVSKGLAIALIVATIIGLFVVIAILIGPSLFNQLSNLFNSIIKFLSDFSDSSNVNLSGIQSTLSKAFSGIIGDLGKVVSDGAMSFIGSSISILSIGVIAFASSIYFLIDMDKIRKKIAILLRKRKRIYNYVKELDNEMMNYLSGFIKIMIISFFEYTIMFTIIGHPDALLLGFFASMAQLIPYFGGIIVNVIASIVSFTISPALFVKTVILFFVLSTIDGNVINPFVYGKTNKIKPLLVIMSVFIGGSLFGILGIIISLPVTILIVTTIRFFKPELRDTIENIKEDLRK